MIDRVKCLTEVNEDGSNLFTAIQGNPPVVYSLQECVLRRVGWSEPRLVRV